MFPFEFNRIWIFLSDFHLKKSQYGNPFRGTRAHTCGRTHKHMDVVKRRLSRLCRRANNNTPKVAINKKRNAWRGKYIYTVNSMALKNRPQRPKREAEVQVYSFFNFGARWGGSGQCHAPASSTPGRTQYPSYRRLGGPQGQSGQVRKILPPPGFDTRTIQTPASRYMAHI